MKSAFDRLVGYLARRDHSEKELRTKLSRFHTREEIAEAIERANERKYIPKPEVLAEKVSEVLLRKGKGPRYISQYLKNKGLPNQKIDDDVESETALHIVIRGLRYKPPFSYEQKQKIQRYLANRGFTHSSISSVCRTKEIKLKDNNE